MTAFKKGHYIPQYLISLFGISERPGQIFRFEKERGTIAVKSIKAVAQENCFYDVNWQRVYRSGNSEVINKMDQTIQTYFHKNASELTPQEKLLLSKSVEQQFLGTYENQFAPMPKTYLSRLDERRDSLLAGYPFFDEEARKGLAHYIAVAAIRSLWFRERALPQYLRLFQQSHHLDETTPDKDTIRTLHLTYLLNKDYLDRYEQSVYKKRWVLLMNESSVPFVLSDNTLSTNGFATEEY